MDSELHVMLDLETLGNAPGCAIVSIGAVVFGGGAIYSEFVQHIQLEDCVRRGLEMDASTVLWWLKQDEVARKALMDGQAQGLPLEHALDVFNTWLGQQCTIEWDKLRIWGKGPSFDCAILAAAYRKIGRRIPWKYSNERCLRTVIAMHPEVPEPEREGVQHDALDDAIHQARWLMKMRPEL